MEPIAEMDDNDDFEFDSPSELSHLNEARSMGQFRSRANTWPQFNNELLDTPEDDTQDKGDLCPVPYSLYESPYASVTHGLGSTSALANSKTLQHLDVDVSTLYPGPPLSTGEFGSSRLSTSREALGSLGGDVLKSSVAYFGTGPPCDSAEPPYSSLASDTRAGELCSINKSPNTNGPAHPFLSRSTSDSAASATGGSSTPSGSTGALNQAALKKNTSRRNAWGNMSYADLITQAINGSPEKRLTLSQIYEWMVQNVAYFKDKGDSNSSAGWKVSDTCVREREHFLRLTRFLSDGR